MLSENFIDLDELVLQCRSNQAKKYIAEAVACYHSGAIRSCIVATWIAVVFDFLEKLKHLELSGDAKAQRKNEEYEKYRFDRNIQALLKFERDVPILARDEFEFISHIECSDLERLLEDRNRCAHPSMNAADEIYSPSAEVARAHLRNAVTHLLGRPPVQGKAALSRIITEIQSMYFPTDIEQAIVHLGRGPLGNPRESLVRNVVTVLLKSVLRDRQDEEMKRKHFAALNGIRRLHPAVTARTIAECLSRIIRSLDDDRLPEVISLLKEIEDTWQFCDNDIKIKLRNVVEKMPENALTQYLPSALDVAPLKQCAENRISYTTSSELFAMVEVSPRTELVNRALDFFTNSETEAEANSHGSRLIIPLAPYLGLSQVDVIFNSIKSNDAVRTSAILGAVLRCIRDSMITTKDQLQTFLEETGLDVTFNWLLAPEFDEEPPVE